MISLFQYNLGENASDKGNNIWFDLVPQAGETSRPGGISRGMARTRASENKTRAHTLDTATQIIKHRVVYSLYHLTMPFFLKKTILTTLDDPVIPLPKKEKKCACCCLWNWNLAFLVSPQLLVDGHLVKTIGGDRGSLLIEVFLFCSILHHVCVDMSVKKKNLLSLCLVSWFVIYFFLV